MVVSHTYSQTGTYDVMLTVTDDDGYTGNITQIIEIVVINQPPDAPVINGPTSGKPETEYEYTFKSTSPLGRDVYYYVEWGDGSIKDWFGPYSSGEEATASYTWSKQGTFTIKARAKDTDNLWGPWGELEVTMPKSQNMWFQGWLDRFPLLQRILDVLKTNMES